MIVRLFQLIRNIEMVKSRAQTATMISAKANNPLKFAADENQLMDLLFASRPGWMGAEEAIEDGFRTLERHQRILIQGAQAAVEKVIKDMSPENLQPEGGEDQGWLTALFHDKDALAWRRYRDHYNQRLGSGEAAREILQDAMTYAMLKE